MIFIKNIFLVYGGKCVSRKAVHIWVEKLSQVRSIVADGALLGWPVEMETEATVQRVEKFIRAHRSITIDSVSTALGCSHHLAYSIMHDRLKFWEVCAGCVPRELKNREKMNRMVLSLQHLLRCADEGEVMLNGIVIGDESWMHH
jgi:hypothetical protein